MGTLGPSAIRDPAHNAMPRVAEREDLDRITRQYGDAALRCQEGGLDGCEILASVHLIGQFLSPLSNDRDDEYGGSLENRARLLIDVLTEVRSRVGDDFVVGLRFTANEANEGGFDADEGVALAGIIGQAGLVDYLHVNGAYGGSAKGMSETFPGMGKPSAPFLDLAKHVRQSSGLPVMQAARITDLATARFAIEDGCLDLVGMVRPHIADPAIVTKLMAGQEDRIRPCVGAALCMDRVDLGGDMVCIHNVSAGREGMFPEQIQRADVSKTVAVVGGGPAGLEAARVAALRGHKVVLFEATDELGGQVVLAARAGWRKDLAGITDWLADEITRLNVEIRFNCLAEADDVLATAPDVVVVATGGVPHVRLNQGGGHLVQSTWEILSGEVPPAETILIYDEVGAHAAISVADWLSGQGHGVELVTPGRTCGAGLGSINYPTYLTNLYAAGARLTPDQILVGVRRDGNGLVATLRNTLTRSTDERHVAQVIADQGTLPNDAVFADLKGVSRNRGQMDLDAFADGRPQAVSGDPGFDLYRVGDAVSGRDIHAAIFDGNRIGRTL